MQFVRKSSEFRCGLTTQYMFVRSLFLYTVYIQQKPAITSEVTKLLYTTSYESGRGRDLNRNFMGVLADTYRPSVHGTDILSKTTQCNNITTTRFKFSTATGRNAFSITD